MKTGDLLRQFGVRKRQQSNILKSSNVQNVPEKLRPSERQVPLYGWQVPGPQRDDGHAATKYVIMRGGRGGRDGEEGWGRSRSRQQSAGLAKEVIESLKTEVERRKEAPRRKEPEEGSWVQRRRRSHKPQRL